MPSASRPYLAISLTAGPDSPNTSFTPILSTGVGAFADKQSQTAEPKPPITECSSTVTTLPVALAAAITSSSSNGLIVWMLITLASIPSAASFSAAARDSATHTCSDDCNILTFS